jgi:hypothetical protein
MDNITIMNELTTNDLLVMLYKGNLYNAYKGVSYIDSTWIHVYIEFNENSVVRVFKNG